MSTAPQLPSSFNSDLTAPVGGVPFLPGPDFIPPLENGDNLTAKEFQRRWENMPELKKAELLNGIVYLPCDLSIDDLDTIDPSIPPLENGDNLTAEEFERRYKNMPNLKKAELVEGVVYMGSPVRIRFHARQGSLIGAWLASYWTQTPGCEGGDNATVKLSGGSWPQPDHLLRLEHGGPSHIDEEGYLVGPPDLAVEISASSVTKDLHQKKKMFLKHRVCEYLVWRVFDSAIDWFVLRDRKYVPQTPDATGLIKSEVFPGLWLDVPAMLRHDLATVLKRLQEGIDSAQHRDFVAQLASRKA